MASKNALAVRAVVLFLFAECIALCLSFVLYNMPLKIATQSLALSVHGFCTILAVLLALFATAIIKPGTIWAIVACNVAASTVAAQSKLLTACLSLLCLVL